MYFNAYNTIIKSDFDLKIRTVIGNPELEIYAQKFELPKLKATKVFRYDTNALFGQKDGVSYLVWPQLFAFKISDTFIQYQFYNIEAIDLLRVFILSEALGIFLFRKGYFLLHGSAVLLHNKATIFLGSPGAGKSSMVAACHTQNHTVLADDMVAIKLDSNNKPHVIPAFGEIRIWEDTAKGLTLNLSNMEQAWEGKNKFVLKVAKKFTKKAKFSLEKIIILSKSKNKSNYDKMKVALELLKYFPLPHHLLKNDLLIKHFKNSLKIINESVTTTTTKRPKNFIELIKYVNKL